MGGPTGRAAPARARPRGLVLRGRVWPGGKAAVFDGAVVVDAAGRVAHLGPAEALEVPADLLSRGSPDAWVGPGLVDAHVHLAFGGPDAMAAGGVLAVRDLGAPPDRAAAWRTGSPPPGAPAVAVAGPVLTAPGGYPSRSWGAAGFAAFVTCPQDAATVVGDLVQEGVDVVKVALEPAGDAAVPSPATLRAVVTAAHDAGLAVTAHALTAAMVSRAVEAGVDELAHTPVEPLPPALVDCVARAGVTVVSTLQTFCSGGSGRAAAANAAALHRAGVPLVYGTDLGNAGTRVGADPRELDRLADAGLGRLGALRAATEGAAAVAGLRRFGLTGRLEVGAPASLVVLPCDPLEEPSAWRRPLAVVAGGVLVEPPGAG